MNRCVWQGRSTATQKPWGEEITWSGLFDGKEIHLKAGHRTSLKFHKHKHELLYIQHGCIKAEIADERHFADPGNYPSRLVTIDTGKYLNVQAGCAYRLTAVDDSIIFEISSGASSTAVVRLEDDYGRPCTGSSKYKFIPPKKENDN